LLGLLGYWYKNGLPGNTKPNNGTNTDFTIPNDDTITENPNKQSPGNTPKNTEEKKSWFGNLYDNVKNKISNFYIIIIIQIIKLIYFQMESENGLSLIMRLIQREETMSVILYGMI
jgi:hypothetical protein